MSTDRNVHLHRVLRAPPERVYRAFLEPDAISKWNAPYGFTARIHEMDARVGGGYRMSFINFATGTHHEFSGEYRELDPGRRIVVSDRFDDPALGGEMTLTVTLDPVSCGTALDILQDGLPEAIPPELCVLGWQESLTLLAYLVEPEIPDGG